MEYKKVYRFKIECESPLSSKNYIHKCKKVLFLIPKRFSRYNYYTLLWLSAIIKRVSLKVFFHEYIYFNIVRISKSIRYIVSREYKIDENVIPPYRIKTIVTYKGSVLKSLKGILDMIGSNLYVFFMIISSVSWKIFLATNIFAVSEIEYWFIKKKLTC